MLAISQLGFGYILTRTFAFVFVPYPYNMYISKLTLVHD